MPFKDKIYDVDWNRLSRWLIPVRRRKQKMLALLYALISPINDLHTRFFYFRAYINYRLGITPQVCYLEQLLNDRFDPAERRIEIVKGVAFDPIPLFLKIESKPVKLFKKQEDTELVLFTKSETAQFSVDFIVRVPIAVPFEMNELTAYLDIDVLPSKIYKVQIV